MTLHPPPGIHGRSGHHGGGRDGIYGGGTYQYVENEQPFDGYGVATVQPGVGFYLFLFFYIIIAFVSVPLLVAYQNKNNNFQQQQVEEQQEHGEDEEAGSPAENIEQPQEQKHEQGKQRRKSEEPRSSRQQQQQKQRRLQSHSQRQSCSSSSVVSGARSTSFRSTLLQDLMDRSYPDQDPQFICQLRGGRSSIRSNRQNIIIRNASQNDHPQGSKQQQKEEQMQIQNKDKKLTEKVSGTDTGSSSRRSGSDSNTVTETSSGVPCAPTTTTQSFQNHRQRSTTGTDTGAGTGTSDTDTRHLTLSTATVNSKRPSELVLDVNSRRWKSRRPIGRVDVIQNAIANEMKSVISGRRRVGSNLSAAGGSATGKRFVSGWTVQKNKNISNSASNGNGVGGKGSVSIKRRTALQQSQRGMSDVASSILSEQHHHLSNQPNIQVDISQLTRDQRQQQLLQFQQTSQEHPAVQHRLQALQRQQNQRSTGMKAAGGGGGGSSRSGINRRGSWLGGRSLTSQSNMSAMSSIVDDIAPEDAADANDPGRGNVFLQDDNLQFLQNVKYRNGNYQGFGVQAACLTTPIEALLKLANPDHDKWHVVKSSILLSIGASSEALFRLISAAIISQYLGTESMVAFLLVGLFVRLTSEELGGAIVDALSSFVQTSMSSPANPSSVQGRNDSTGMYIAGQYVQLACLAQLALQVPLLIVWVVVMEPIVFWFTSSSLTAAIAQDYTVIVIVAYLVQALSRTLTVIFHICGHEHFESVIDMASSMIQVISIAFVTSQVDEVNLTTVAYIQVLVTISSAITKIVFPVMRGWMRPIRRGLLQNMAVVQNKAGLPSLLRATFFLMCGAILEYGQWELMTIFVRFLGPAEVATWVLLGALWDFLEAFTEGIGEAAANQVAFLLSLGHAQLAKELSFSSVYWALIQSFLVASTLLMSGQYLAVLLSTDPTIQHLFNNNIPMLSAANIAMAFSQINWSLIGSQGRFRLGTVAVFFSRWFVTIPVAAISIFAFNFDLNAVSGALLVGYITSSNAMLFVLLRTDWVRLAITMQSMNAPPNDYEESKTKEKNVAVNPVLGELDLDDFDDGSDDSEGFGF